MAERATAIDIHGHGIPKKLLDEIRRDGDRVYGGMAVAEGEAGPVVTIPGLGRIRPLAAQMLDFRDRLAWLDEHQIGQQIVSPWLDMQGYEMPPEPAARWAAAMNEAVAAECAGSGGRLIGMSTLAAGDPKAAVAELERSMRDLHLPAVMLSTDPGQVVLHDPSLEQLWAAAEQLGAVFVLHPSITGPASHIPNTTEFANLYWRGIDTMLAATRLILAGVFDRYPRLRIVLLHGGGFLPYQTARLDRSYAINTIGPKSLARPNPTDYLSDFYHDTCLLSPPALRLLHEVAGEGKIVLGSDYPFPIGDPDPVGTVTAAGFDERTNRQVLHDTAAALFGIA
ncbi:MAG TPA: amidohydrolase family protein [Dehalococcoidia bacterium]|nr:amidohydrolase family protein [Dehalococcoidia bacterium]